jgi:signal transduction histidine kinase
MRTPLNGINGLSELIKMTVADPEVQEYAEMQIKSTERLLQTINKILEMSKIESNTITHNFEKINVVESVSNSLKPLKILAFSKQQQFIVNFHQNSSDFNIITDPLIFDQILINIVSNAIKYTPEGGKIEVNLKLIDQGYKCFLMLSVEDSGEGISQENLDKIFEKFFTEKDTTKQKDNSSGIGLYIVKKYVEYLQGVIKVESKKNLGSLFTVKIPITTS